MCEFCNQPWGNCIQFADVDREGNPVWSRERFVRAWRDTSWRCMFVCALCNPVQVCLPVFMHWLRRCRSLPCVCTVRWGFVFYFFRRLVSSGSDGTCSLSDCVFCTITPTPTHTHTHRHAAHTHRHAAHTHTHTGCREGSLHSRGFWCPLLTCSVQDFLQDVASKPVPDGVSLSLFTSYSLLCLLREREDFCF